MKLISIMLLVLCLSICSISWGQISKFNENYHRYTKEKNAKKEHPLLNDSTMLLTKIASDSEYAFSELKPVMLGLAYVPDSAANFREKYLNALRGPAGEEVYYERMAACCTFHTPNQLRHWLKQDPKQTEFGLLERYKIWYGNKEEKVLYINIYDEGEVFIPQGFKASK